MKNITETIKSNINESTHVSGGPFNERLAKYLLPEVRLYKHMSDYSSFDKMVDDACDKMEMLIYTATNEYTIGYLIAGLLKYVDDNRETLERKVKEEENEFNDAQKYMK